MYFMDDQGQFSSIKKLIKLGQLDEAIIECRNELATNADKQKRSAVYDLLGDIFP